MPFIYNLLNSPAALEDAQKAIAFVAGLLTPPVVIGVAYLGWHLYRRQREFAVPRRA